MEKQVNCAALHHSQKVSEVANVLLNCPAFKGLTYKEAVEVLNITEEKLGEKAMLLPDRNVDRQTIADSIVREIADGISSSINSSNQP